MLLENRVAIVSGIGPGMGRDIALLLARHGANLALGARSPSRRTSRSSKTARAWWGRPKRSWAASTCS